MTNFLISMGISRTYAGDISLLLLMILASIALMFIVRKSKVGAFVFAVYVAYLITETLYFNFFDVFINKVVVFLILALVLHYGLFKLIVVVKLGGGNMTRWVKRIIISFVVVGFMASIILNWMPDREVVKLLSPFAMMVFTTSIAKLIWVIIPVVVLFIVKRRY